MLHSTRCAHTKGEIGMAIVREETGASDLVVTITKTITKLNCSSFTKTVTITKSKSNIKTILKLNQNTENYIKTVTKPMLKVKRFSKFELFTI